MTEQVPLRERKKRRAQESIVDAAYALFAERGFADVTVTEIAERAEVGRTTFFRYFGDKQEVLFVDERKLLAAVLAAPPWPSRPTFREALEEARTAVALMCATVTADGDRYRLHEKLMADNEELHDRSERKLLSLTEAMANRLTTQGMAPPEAALAAHVGLACYRAGRTTAGDDPAALGPAVDNAFEVLLRD